MTAVPAVRGRPTPRLGITDRTLAAIFVLPTVLLVLVFAVYPFARAIWDSLYTIDFVTGQRTFIGLSNYTQVLTSREVQASFVRTIIWIIGNLVLEVPAGIAIAILLNAKLVGRNLARGLVLFPYMVPAIVLALVFQFLLNDSTGLVNYLLQSVGLIRHPLDLLGNPNTVLATMIVVNSWKFTPFIIIVVLARLQTLPPELYEAAAMDGAGRLAVYRHVTYPWIRGVVILATLLRTIWAAYEYDVPYLLAYGGPLGSSTTVPIEIKSLAFDKQQLGAASALAVLVGIFLFFAGSFFVRAFRRNERRM